MTFPRNAIILSMLFGFVLLCNSAWAGDPNLGAKIYKKHCINCHGSNGRSKMPGTPHLTQGQSLIKPDTVLAEVVKKGKKMMPAYLGVLKEQDIADVITYIRTLH